MPQELINYAGCDGLIDLPWITGIRELLLSPDRILKIMMQRDDLHALYL